MNAYMGYSRIAGRSEGAVLIFANTSKEAKKVFWNNDPDTEIIQVNGTVIQYKSMSTGTDLMVNRKE